MALALKDRVKETTIVVGTGTATLLGSSIGFQPFSVVGNGNTTYYCISDQFGSNWEVGIGTYSTSGNTLARTTVLASSNGGALVVFTAGIKDVFVTYPAEKGVWLDASGNAIGLGTPAAFVGTNITGTASGLTAGNVTTNANLTGAVTSTGNATSLGSFTSAQLATALTNETGSGSAVFSDNATLLNPTYTGTLTGSTGILNIGSGQVYKDASGNVGIGTSTPGTTLQLGAPNAVLRIGITASNQYGELSRDNVTGNIILNAAQTGFGNLVFQTTSTERMRIDSSGNVGIGTSNPDATLSIQTATTDATLLQEVVRLRTTGRTSTTGTNNRGTLLSFFDESNPTLTSAIGGIRQAPSVNFSGALAFYTNTGASPATNVSQLIERMRIDTSGNLLVGTTAVFNSGKIATSFDSAANVGIALKQTNANNSGTFLNFAQSGTTIGTITGNATNTAYNTSSDQRLKENIVDAPSALASVNAIKVRSFDWKSDGTHVDYGYIAQELLEVAPEAVAVPEDEDEMMGVDFGKLTPRLVKAIQELKAIIDTQQEQINSLLGK